MRRWLLAVVVGAGATLDAQPRVHHLAIGRFGATDQEIQECYFNIGTGAMLILDPKGDMCSVARDLIGRTGELVFVVD